MHHDGTIAALRSLEKVRAGHAIGIALILIPLERFARQSIKFIVQLLGEAEMDSDNAIAAQHRLESVLIIAFFLAIMLLPPNGFARNDISIRLHRFNNMQVIGYYTIATGASSQQGIVKDGIIEIRDTMPDKTTALAHGAAINHRVMSQSEIEEIPCVAIVLIRRRDKHRIPHAFGIYMVGVHLPNVRAASYPIMRIGGIIAKVQLQVHDAVAT